MYSVNCSKYACGKHCLKSSLITHKICASKKYSYKIFYFIKRHLNVTLVADGRIQINMETTTHYFALSQYISENRA